MTEKYFCFYMFIILLKYVNTQSAEIPCKSDTDCKEVEGSKCLVGFCKCEVDEVLSSDITKCLPLSIGYGSDCTDSLQCSYWLLMGSECNLIESKCSCKKGYHYRNGRCYKTSNLLQACTRDEECYDGYDIEALQCKNGICNCNDNYFNRMDLDCRRKSTKIGDPCIIDIECQFKNAICARNFTCQSAGGDNDYIYSVPNMPPEENVTDLSSKCENDADCTSVDNSYCRGHCRCPQKYRMDIKRDYCQPELNVKTDESNCIFIRNSEYRDGKCLCRIGFSYAANMEECIKATRVISNHSCTIDINCHTFGSAAVCNTKTQTCECGGTSWYHNESMICRIPKGIDESCVNDDDCYLDPEISKTSPKCVNKKCTCPKNTYPTGNNTLCQEKYVELGESCSQTSDCKTVYSECLNNICKCKKTYYENEKMCSAGIGNECSQDSDCQVINSYCNATDKLCNCQEGYVNSNHKCYKTKNFEEPCELDIQCEEKLNYKNSACIEKKCNCKKGYHYRSKKCWATKYLGETCTRDGECYIESEPSTVECRNSECLCVAGYQKDVKGLTCGRSHGLSYFTPMNILFYILIITIISVV